MTLQRLGMAEAQRAGLIALVAALIWWLPRHIGQTYIQFYHRRAPHNSGTETGRYSDIRCFRSAVGNIGSMGLQFHHLYPRIPLMRTPAACWAVKPVLEPRRCRLDGL